MWSPRRRQPTIEFVYSERRHCRLSGDHFQTSNNLLDASRKGTVGLHQDTIGQRLQSCNNRFRLFHVFRNKNGKMHPLWNVLICRVEPGIYALKMDDAQSVSATTPNDVSDEDSAPTLASSVQTAHFNHMQLDETPVESGVNLSGIDSEKYFG